METQNNQESTVVSLSQVRSLSEQIKQEESISRYLGILSFSQLIHETSNAIDKLNGEDISKQVAIKSKLVFKELGDRIEQHSSQHYPILTHMRKQIDKKIKDIQSYL